MNPTTRHEELLADFRAKAEYAKTLREQSMVQHRANLSSQMARMSEEASRKERRQTEHAAHMEQVRLQVEAEVVQGIDTVEANLRRLGLDNSSAHRAPRSASDTHKEGRRSTRPTMIQGSSMGGGVVAFLRRTGEKSGVEGTSLFMSKDESPLRSRQKLSGAKVLYPTMRAKVDESDEDAQTDRRDVNFEALNDEYVNKIRRRKDDDVQALREREVRRHRMNGEQSRSKNQVLEQKELEKLLMRAKLINAPDRQRVIDKRIEGIQKGLEKKLRAEMIGRRREAASATVEAQLQNHLHETVEQRNAELAAFAVLRKQGRKRDNFIKSEKLKDKEAFCRMLIGGIVDMAGEVIKRSTSTLQDGSEQYNRATLGVTEWREMVTRHLSPHAVSTTELAEAVDYPAPSAVQSVVELPLQVPVSKIDVTPLVDADVEYFCNRVGPASRMVVEEPRSFGVIFVDGDSIISGVDLLAQNGDATFSAGEKREYILLTPQLVLHLEFQAARRALDESLRDVEEALVQVTTDLQSKQSQLASQTPMVKGKRDTKTKDTSPLAQSVMQLSSAHSELTQQQSSIRSELTKLYAHANEHSATDAELGALVGSLILLHRCHDRLSPEIEPGNQVPLTTAHLQTNPDLEDAVLIFAGFPLTTDFGSAVRVCVDDLSSVAYCDLGCDAVSAVRRLDGVQEFIKYPRPAPVVVEADAVQSKKKGVKIAPPTPSVSSPMEEPRAVLAHPMLSPLVVYRGEQDQAPVPTPPPAAPTGRASPSTLRSNSISILVPTPCLDANDLEYATSPYMVPRDTDRSTSRAKFTKVMKWYSGKEPQQFSWLRKYTHNDLPEQSLSRMDRARSSLGGIHCFEAVVDDAVLGDTIVSNLVPGTAAHIPEVDDTVYFSQFVILTAKLCGRIVASQIEASVKSTPVSLPINQSDFTSAAVSYRSALALSLQAVEKCLVEAASYMSNTGKCFPAAIFSAVPVGDGVDTEDGLALARWKQCDHQRKLDTAVITALLTDLDASVADALSAITIARSQTDLSSVDKGAVEGYWSHGVDMIKSLQEQCRCALHEWCLHLFTLHCEVIEKHDGFFTASSEFRPKSPAEILSIISVVGTQIHSKRNLDFKPDVSTYRPTPAQMGMALWSCSLEGCVGDYVSPEHYARCSCLLTVVAAAAPSIVTANFDRSDEQLFGGLVPLGWILMKTAMGRITPSPSAFQAIKFAAALHSASSSEFLSLPWWGVDSGVTSNLLALRQRMKPGEFEPFLLAFIAADSKSQTKPSLLRRWFAVIGSFESGVPSETGSLSKESLLTKFPRGSWDAVDLNLLQYLAGESSGSITIEALSSTPLGELLLENAAMSFTY